MSFILSLDEGTTSARAIVWDKDSTLKGIGQYEFEQIYPKPGWVEHNPEEIWTAQMNAIKDALKNAKTEPSKIHAIGVTNQRETTILWDKNNGKPIYNAIVWQCRRTADIIDWLKNNGYSDMIIEKTGLIPDSYFSAPKIKWILENVPNAREKAEKGELLFGTVDTYLIWRLSSGKLHVTDYTNASRTMLFNITKLEWDSELLELFNIPEEILPEVKESSEIYGYTDEKVFGSSVPISGDAGDQQAALFGQTCFDVGNVKSTYGTGNFILMNTGKKKPKSEHGLLTTIAYGINGDIFYALEGSVFITGAAIQWLRDGLKIIKSASETEEIAKTVPDNGGVYFVPAFVGLGAPYWDQYARGVIIGITRGTTRAHIVRAALESIAYQTKDVLDAMEHDSNAKITSVKVDGGASNNDFLMQFQADITRIEIIRPVIKETTALGAAYLAGLATDFWDSMETIKKQWKVDKVFQPKISKEMSIKLYRLWKKAVEHAKGWAE